MNIMYLRYMRSPEWAALRLKVLERDGYRCMGWIEHIATEVHHRTYARLGHEDMADLVSLCSACHQALTSVIRAERFQARRLRVHAITRVTPPASRVTTMHLLQVTPVYRMTPSMERIDRGIQKLDVSPTQRRTIADAPRRHG